MSTYAKYHSTHEGLHSSKHQDRNYYEQSERSERSMRRSRRSSRSSERTRPRVVIQTGKFGSELGRIIQDYREKELIGRVPSASTKPELFEKMELISNFLAQHRLAEAAKRSSPRNKPNDQDAYISTASYYLPTLDKFAESQLERQNAGLRTNANKVSADGLGKLVEAHSSALQAALAEDDGALISSDTLCWIQGIVCPTDEQSGVFRTNEARAGRTIFCRAESIDRQIELVWDGLEILQSDWFERKKYKDSVKEEMTKMYHSIALAAIAMYAINDVHPFADGNGRTSRIYANAFLKQYLNLPFTVTIAATPQQRQEYIDGIQHARTVVRQIDEGEELRSRQARAMEPLIKLLVERIAHAVVQVQSILTEEARALSHVSHEEEERIATRVRQRAARGQCIICLDSNPNIATLCCGQAVHLNCIAEWLANGSTCVFCRTPLPRLELSKNQGHRARLCLDETCQATTPSASSAVSVVSAATVGMECSHCNGRRTEDCSNGMCGRCCLFRGRGQCERHGNMGAHHDETEIISQNFREERNHGSSRRGDDVEEREAPECTSCGGHASAECINGMCRRCCNRRGTYECNWHR